VPALRNVWQAIGPDVLEAQGIPDFDPENPDAVHDGPTSLSAVVVRDTVLEMADFHLSTEGLKQAFTRATPYKRDQWMKAAFPDGESYGW